MLKEDRELDFYTVRIAVDKRSGIVQNESWELAIVEASGSRRQVMHRVDGPARIIRDPDTGIVVQEEWFRRGEYHRVGGPASIERSSNTGIVTYEDWFINDNNHRDDGPALIRRDENTGEIRQREWWCHGKQIRPTSARPKPHRVPRKVSSAQPR